MGEGDLERLEKLIKRKVTEKQVNKIFKNVGEQLDDIKGVKFVRDGDETHLIIKHKTSFLN